MKKWNPIFQKYYNRFKKGEKVVIKNYCPKYNYRIGTIKKIDGGYFYVRVGRDLIEVYESEIVSYERVYK